MLKGIEPKCHILATPTLSSPSPAAARYVDVLGAVGSEQEVHRGGGAGLIGGSLDLGRRAPKFSCFWDILIILVGLTVGPHGQKRHQSVLRVFCEKLIPIWWDYVLKTQTGMIRYI
jgi:hypothetical protein